MAHQVGKITQNSESVYAETGYAILPSGLVVLQDSAAAALAEQKLREDPDSTRAELERVSAIRVVNPDGTDIAASTTLTTILTNIYDEMKDDTDDEYVLYYDQVADAWYYGMWSTDDGGNPTVSYFDTDGTPAVPANPVEPVKGKIHMAEVARWEALISGGADKEWTEGDILSERLITFLPEGTAPVNLSRAWYNTGGPTVIPEWSTFASYSNQMPKRYFRVLGGDHTWIPTVSLYYERTGGALVIQPGVPLAYGGDGWIKQFDCCRVLIEILDDGGSPFYYSRTGLFNVASFAKESKAATGDIIELVGQRQMIGFAFYQYAAVTQKFKVTLYQA